MTKFVPYCVLYLIQKENCMRYRTAAQTAQNDWNTQLRKKVNVLSDDNKKIKEKLEYYKNKYESMEDLDKLINELRKSCAADYCISQDGAQIEVRINYGDKFVFGRHIERGKAVFLAVQEVKRRIN